MGQPVVWFEVLGSDGARSQRFYSELFGWRPRPAEGAPDYGLVDGPLPGGVGQAQGAPHVTFYVGVADAAATLARAEASGGAVLAPPRRLPDGDTIALLRDPDGLTVGLFQKG